MDQSHEPPSPGPGIPPAGAPLSEGEGGSVVNGGGQFRGGTIELRSGRWKWTAHVGGKGAAIVFLDERSPNNRMRSWLPEALATDEEILRAGQEPDLRWWEDPVGTVWETRVEETLFPMRMDQRTRPRRRIVFEQGSHRLGTELPEGRTLGELTAAELTALHYEST